MLRRLLALFYGPQCICPDQLTVNHSNLVYNRNITSTTGGVPDSDARLVPVQSIQYSFLIHSQLDVGKLGTPTQ